MPSPNKHSSTEHRPPVESRIWGADPTLLSPPPILEGTALLEVHVIEIFDRFRDSLVFTRIENTVNSAKNGEGENAAAVICGPDVTTKQLGERPGRVSPRASRGARPRSPPISQKPTRAPTSRSRMLCHMSFRAENSARSYKKRSRTISRHCSRSAYRVSRPSKFIGLPRVHDGFFGTLPIGNAERYV